MTRQGIVIVGLLAMGLLTQGGGTVMEVVSGPLMGESTLHLKKSDVVALYLDDYEHVEQVGLLYSSMAIRRGHRQTHEACIGMLNANIPFGLVVAGDDWLVNQLSQKDLDRHELTVVAGPPELYHDQKN